MSRKVGRFLSVAGLALMISMAGLVSAAQAGLLTDLTVDVGANHFAIWSQSALANHIPLGGVNITSQQAIFTQNGTTSGDYNFDSSDVSCPTPCLIHVNVTIAGNPTFVFTDSSSQGPPTPPPSQNVLHANQQDVGGSVNNEATSWVLLGSFVEANGSTLTAFAGYADNAHSGKPCVDNTGASGLETAANCHPDLPWNPGGAFFFGNTITGGCVGGVDPCFDSGAIRLTETPPSTKTPEPSTVLLLGAGLIGLSAWRRMRMKE